MLVRFFEDIKGERMELSNWRLAIRDSDICDWTRRLKKGDRLRFITIQYFPAEEDMPEDPDKQSWIMMERYVEGSDKWFSTKREINLKASHAMGINAFDYDIDKTTKSTAVMHFAVLSREFLDDGVCADILIEDSGPYEYCC